MIGECRDQSSKSSFDCEYRPSRRLQDRRFTDYWTSPIAIVTITPCLNDAEATRKCTNTCFYGMLVSTKVFVDLLTHCPHVCAFDQKAVPQTIPCFTSAASNIAMHVALRISIANLEAHSISFCTALKIQDNFSPFSRSFHHIYRSH